eukprot:CAMPEP_0117443882 /NCGR_PEP_ID=MMETSP0759-20121206/4939_1 /TAXON_ID=63605 /ORGANISM="Percolomonas cosmopolitus, Strain WS" /LENGTH=602 /DNA_ID=CAMNT_0005235901 /DNA_START=91 /DNA_END=1896 /DNA_ORIENTATION=+
MAHPEKPNAPLTATGGGQKRKFDKVDRSDSAAGPQNNFKKKKLNPMKETVTKINKMLAEYHNVKASLKKIKKEGLSKEERKQKELQQKEKVSVMAQGILDKIQGKLFELSRKRPGSVTIQTLLKEHSLRESIFQELKPHLMEMSSNVYAVHIVLAFLKCGGKIRSEVVEFASVNAAAMLTLQESCRVVNEIFETGKGPEKKSLLRAFYGSERHTDEIVDILKEHDFALCGLTKYCQKEQDKAFHITKRLNDVVSKAVNKELLSPFSFLHYLVNEALNLVTADKARFLVSDILEQLVHIVHTPFGRDVAIKCIYFGRTKERKVIMKEFKRFAVPGAKDINAALVMCTLADMTDDTKRSFESVFKPLLSELGELLTIKSAASVLLFPFAPCNKFYYSPSHIEAIRPTLRDDIYEKSSSNYHVHKKPKDEIHSQLCEQLYEPLMQELLALDLNDFSAAHLLPLISELIKYTGPVSQSDSSQKARKKLIARLTESIVNDNTALKDFEYQKTLGHLLKDPQAASLCKALTSYVKGLKADKLSELVIERQFGIVLANLMKHEELYPTLKKHCAPIMKEVTKKLDEKNLSKGLKFTLKFLTLVHDNPKF